MLEKNFDIAVIGRNYLSFLFAIGQVELKQKVLVLDDQRLSFGDLYQHGLGPIEYYFLKTWGEDRGITPLKEIDRYFVKRPLHIFFNDRWLQLRSKPSQNMLELLRRFGELFGEDCSVFWKGLLKESQRQKFDEGVEQLAKLLGQNAFRYQTVESFNIDFFLSQCPPFLKKIFEAFRSYFEENRFKSEKNGYLLAFLSRAFFLKNLSPNIASYEIFHMFINFLGPSYSLDQEKLEQDLVEFFVNCGGQFKKTEVREWKFHKGRPWCLELASFEGIIHPRKIAFVGGRPQGMPLKLSEKSSSYEGIILENSVSLREARHLPKGNFIFGDASRVGTAFPFWWFELLGEVQGRQQFRIHFLSSLESGSKIEFFQEQILSLVEKDLSKVFPWVLEELEGWSIGVGSEIYVHEAYDKKKTNLPLGRNVDFFDYSSPSYGKRIKNVYYFGPYLESPLGLLSKFMEMKQGHYYL